MEHVESCEMDERLHRGVPVADVSGCHMEHGDVNGIRQRGERGVCVQRQGHHVRSWCEHPAHPTERTCV